ncbi:hypothetical protein OSTOST_19783, partial [Ostertagia ostertagi]
MVSPSAEVTEAFAETMQSLGLLLDKKSRLSLISKIVDSLNSAQLLDMFCLFVLQSQDPLIMRQVLMLPFCGERSSSRLCTGIANHEENSAEAFSLKETVTFDIDCALAKGMLLSGKTEGLKLFEQLLGRLCRENTASGDLLLDQLNDLLDFDSAANNPERCLFRTTFLWRQ